MIKAYRTGLHLAALGLATAVTLSAPAPAFAGEAPAPPARLQPSTTVAPSPALIAGIQAMIKRGPAYTPAVREWPDGTLALTLGGSFLNLLVAQAQPDGTFRTFCVTAPDAAKTLSTAAVAAPAYEEK